ncbi:hypothetical protein GW17_00023382 [Ensete ventricosum]|nr:hypothetical protein GW17_00023382 [Ensete ventricosum]
MRHEKWDPRDQESVRKRVNGELRGIRIPKCWCCHHIVRPCSNSFVVSFGRGRLQLSDEVHEVVIGGAGHRGGGQERPKEFHLGYEKHGIICAKCIELSEHGIFAPLEVPPRL